MWLIFDTFCGHGGEAIMLPMEIRELIGMAMVSFAPIEAIVGVEMR